jgi:hypothetical protein
MHSEIDCFNVHTSMCRHVTVLRIVPGMSLDTVSRSTDTGQSEHYAVPGMSLGAVSNHHVYTNVAVLRLLFALMTRLV